MDQLAEPAIPLTADAARVRSCEWCDAPLGRRQRRWCSKSHAALAREAARKTGANVTCPDCGTTRYLSPSVVARMGDGYCIDCWSERLQEYVCAWREERRRLHDELKSEQGIVDTVDVVERSGRVAGWVRQRAAAGELDVIIVSPVDNRTQFYSHDSEKAWRRQLTNSKHPAHKRWRSIEYVKSWLVGRGELTRLLATGIGQVKAWQELERQAADMVTRHKSAGQRLGGRPPGTRPRKELHAWWARRLDEIMASSGATRWAAAKLLAQIEAEHAPELFPPARYPRAPHGFGLNQDAETAAAGVIYNAVNRLQKRTFKNPS